MASLTPQPPQPAAGMDLKTLVQPSAGAIPVIDPKLKQFGRIWVPEARIVPTAGLERYRSGHPYPPSLCLLYQRQKCQARSRCNQIHVQREFVQAARQVLQDSTKGNCCLEHGDMPSTRAEFHVLCQKMNVMVISDDYSFSSRINPGCIAATAFWDKAISACTAGQVPTTVMVRASEICILHQRVSCRYGVDCKHVHLCRNLFAQLATSLRIPLLAAQPPPATKLTPAATTPGATATPAPTPAKKKARSPKLTVAPIIKEPGPAAAAATLKVPAPAAPDALLGLPMESLPEDFTSEDPTAAAEEAVDQVLAETLGFDEDELTLRSPSSGLGSFVQKWAPILNGLSSSSSGVGPAGHRPASPTPATPAAATARASVLSPLRAPNKENGDASDNDSDVEELRFHSPIGSLARFAPLQPARVAMGSPPHLRDSGAAQRGFAGVDACGSPLLARNGNVPRPGSSWLQAAAQACGSPVIEAATAKLFRLSRGSPMKTPHSPREGNKLGSPLLAKGRVLRGLATAAPLPQQQHQQPLDATDPERGFPAGRGRPLAAPVH